MSNGNLPAENRVIASGHYWSQWQKTVPAYLKIVGHRHFLVVGDHPSGIKRSFWLPLRDVTKWLSGEIKL